MTTAKGTRLSPDARRDQLLALGLELLGRTPPDQVSIEAIARAAGISKGLLYHYFPTKDDFVAAVLRRSREELERRMAPDPDAPPRSLGEGLDASLDAFLGYVEEHAVGFLAIAHARGDADDRVRAVIRENRARRVAAMVDFATLLAAAPREDVESPALLVALDGWLAFCQGAVARWLERGKDVARDDIRHLMRSNLLATLASVAEVDHSPAAARLAHAADALRTGSGHLLDR